MTEPAGRSLTEEGTPAERPWAFEPADVAAALGTDPITGLTSEEARRRIAEHGPNELAEEPRKPPWRMLLEQFANTMIVVLLIAAGVTALVGDVKDTVVIAAIVVLNAVIGFVQEYRAEQAMAALKRMTAPLARVRRDDEIRVIAAREVVPGDLLVLEAGDVVAADARLLEAPNLRINEAALTGESVPVDKTVDPIPEPGGKLVADRRNMAFKGTAVVYGRAVGVVTATGMRTAFGQIAELLRSRQAPRTPLQQRLAVLGQRLAVAALVICAVVFAAGVARGEPVSLMFLTAVSLAVAAIPEALPAVVTVSLALGAQRMARRRALVRKLPAVETLGSVTVICVDKTGTLTQGRMQVQRVWTLGGEIEVTGSGYEPSGAFLSGSDPVEPDGIPGMRELLTTAALCNDAALLPPAEPGAEWEVAGDPTEGALLALAAKAGLDRASMEASLPRVAEVPFDAERRRMTTVHRTPQGDLVIATKGAPESVLNVCSAVIADGGARPASDGDRDRIRAVADDLARRGFRVLALAGRRCRSLPGRPERTEHGLAFYGLVAMADPLRPESAPAVLECQRAGIFPVMITGDHPETARAVASRLGLLAGEERRVCTGEELAAMGPDLLRAQIAGISVYARTAPEQKLDIVEAWKSRGDIVAMTGDGVNDAPALRRADIGVAMGVTGTEVAKEAADMVLADDNFATIVAAVREGRRIYDNIRRFVRYTLTSNSGEIWVMFLAPFLGLPLPLFPVHILWINLVTDGLPGLALGVEPPERDVMRRPPRPPSESVFARGLWQHVVLVGLLMGGIPLALGAWGHATGRPWRTMVFVSLAMLQLGQALAVRSETRSLFDLKVGTNPQLLWAVVGTFLLQLAVVYWPPAQQLLRTEALALPDLAVVLGASTGVFWAVELEKLARRRRTRRSAADHRSPREP
jgi:Ca2+-transporting ATPase